MTAAQHRPQPQQAGQSSMEYVLLCAVVAFALGIGMGSEDSALRQLLQAFALAYQNLTFTLALP
jgi:hypothetical protein